MSPLAALVVALASLTTSTSFSLASKCPSVPVVEDLCTDKLNGTWYQIGQHNTIFFQGPGTCVNATYINQHNGSFSVTNQQKSVFGTHQEINGYLVLADTNSTKGILKVTLYIPLIGAQTSTLYVLATNCKDILIFYSCIDIFGLFTFKVGWILSKNQTANWDDLKKIATPMLEPSAKNGGLNITDFSETKQTNCG